MSLTALLLVLTAAVLHAVWNLFAKRAQGGLPFVYFVALINTVLYVPVVAVYFIWWHPSLSWAALAWIAGSGLLKTCYGLFLQRGYRAGDFSLIYPLARGTGPLLSTLAAILLLGERPSLIAIAGGLVIIAGILILTDATTIFHKDRAHLRIAMRYGVASGMFIAAYTIWDRHGVAGLAIPPVLYDAGTTLTTIVLLTPFALRRQPELARHWREHKVHATSVAAFSSLAYILVLTALAFTPVSYIAPAREVSIVIGAFLGARVLKEAQGARRIWAAAAMAVGILALAVG